MWSLLIDEIPVTCFRFEPVPEPFERLVDTSVFVVKLGKAVSRIELVVDQLGLLECTVFRGWARR